MAITTNAICNSFKKELLEGAHKFQAAPNGSTYKLAMFTNSATLGKSTVGYATTNEVTSPSGYTAGGKALVNVGTSLATNTAITDFADLSFVGVTLTARGALIYNSSTTAGSANRAVVVLDFGADKTATSGDFTVQFPTADASNAIIRIA